MTEPIVHVKGAPLASEDLTADGIDLAHKLSNLIDQMNHLYEQRANAKNLLVRFEDEIDRAHLLADFLSNEVWHNRLDIHQIQTRDSKFKIN